MKIVWGQSCQWNTTDLNPRSRTSTFDSSLAAQLVHFFELEVFFFSHFENLERLSKELTMQIASLQIASLQIANLQVTSLRVASFLNINWKQWNSQLSYSIKDLGYVLLPILLLILPRAVWVQNIFGSLPVTWVCEINTQININKRNKNEFLKMPLSCWLILVLWISSVFTRAEFRRVMTRKTFEDAFPDGSRLAVN